MFTPQDFAMNKHIRKRPSAALLSLLLSGLMLTGAFAQQTSGAGSSQSGASDASKGSTMTGGAEAKPTDQGTPGGTAAPEQSSTGTSGTSGASDASKGSTMTGGAEAKPTDQATPGAGQGKQ
jgi:hypothetical protein